MVQGLDQKTNKVLSRIFSQKDFDGVWLVLEMSVPLFLIRWSVGQYAGFQSSPIFPFKRAAVFELNCLTIQFWCVPYCCFLFIFLIYKNKTSKYDIYLKHWLIRWQGNKASCLYVQSYKVKPTAAFYQRINHGDSFAENIHDFIFQCLLKFEHFIEK